jgi:hypothetical protein
MRSASLTSAGSRCAVVAAALPAKVHPDHRAVLEEIDASRSVCGLFAEIDGKRAVADDAAPTVAQCKTVTAEELPREITADAEAANIATELQFLSGEN